MQALVLSNGTLQFTADHPQPEPGAGEALIRVLRAGICNTDLELVRGYQNFAGVPGHEFVGVVERCVGRPEWVGRRVVGEINLTCGVCRSCRAGMLTHCLQRRVLGIHAKDGAFASLLTLSLENLHAVPDGLSDEEAVFVEPLAACFEILEQVQIRPTTAVLVLGDGKLGLLAAQVLRLAGASVTLQGKHAEKLALAERLGLHTRLGSGDAANRNEQAHEQVGRTGERVFDVVVECTGSAAGLEEARQLVRPRGTIVLKSTVASESRLHLAPFAVDEITLVGSRCGPFAPALAALAQKRVAVLPLMSASYPLSAGVEAFAHAARPGVLKVQLELTHQSENNP
jgi:threonine dehydrogenase-like Zn-dependent dehydrogenase